MSAFASGAARAFERLSDRGGAQPGDVRLFDRDPGPGWVAEDASVPYSERRAPFLLLDGVGNFQTTVAPFASQDIMGLTRVGDRIYVWQGQRVAYTDDGGDTFTTLTTTATLSVIFGGAVIFNGLLVLAGYAPGANAAFIDVSSDGGATFARRFSSNNVAWSFMEVVDGAIFLGGGPGLYRSTDGLNFTNIGSTGSASIRSILANGPYLHVGTTSGIVTIRRDDLTLVNNFSPNDMVVMGLTVGPDGIYAVSQNVVYRSAEGLKDYNEFARLTVPITGGNSSIDSIAYTDGLFMIGWGRIGSQQAVVQTTRDFRSMTNAVTLTGSGQDGIKKILKFKNKILVGGMGFARGTLSALRGLSVSRKPPGRLTAKAYTRL